LRKIKPTSGQGGSLVFISLLRNRRSIGTFEARTVEQEKVDILIEAALRSPSSRGYNPWDFVVVTDPDLLSKLSLAKPHGSSFIKNAPLGIVVCADPDKCDVWVEDTSIATILVQLTAESLGLASCWIQIRERSHSDVLSAEGYIRALLGIPDNIRVASMIALGYAGETKAGHLREVLQDEKVHLNRY
jgi:nitroreductase